MIIALADLLFYPHEPGISFALFFAALTTAVAALYPRRMSDPRTLAMGAVALLSALPPASGGATPADSRHPGAALSR